ncbi:MAG TPA: YHS domain-containing protein [Ktedonobacterales bacterium]|jgi:Cu+-exporting ATPase
MAMAIDPVCGMEVDTDRPAGTSEYEGTTYYFCSTGCKRRFDAAPEQFAPQMKREDEGAK